MKKIVSRGSFCFVFGIVSVAKTTQKPHNLAAFFHRKFNLRQMEGTLLEKGEHLAFPRSYIPFWIDVSKSVIPIIIGSILRSINKTPAAHEKSGLILENSMEKLHEVLIRIRER